MGLRYILQLLFGEKSPLLTLASLGDMTQLGLILIYVSSPKVVKASTLMSVLCVLP